MPSVLLLLVYLFAGIGCTKVSRETGIVENPPEARFIKEIPWAGQGIWLKADTHVHTRFSDGAFTIEEVLQKAAEFECNVIAITDHADRLDPDEISEYVTTLRVSREALPELTILTGLEWNIPPWGGDDHATVLLPPGVDAELFLATFIKDYDDYHREVHDPQLTLDALAWLEKQAGEGNQLPVVMMNHPSRKNEKSMEVVEPARSWLEAGPCFIGLSGAPGHQAGTRNGAYDYMETPIDRWDPIAARIGDAWDTLLKTHDVYAALAPSDFHYIEPGSTSDFWPGQFSETWIYAPDRTEQGVLSALRAGSFFAAHGWFCREVQLSVSSAGLSRPAVAGESIEVAADAEIDVAVTFQPAETDWEGNPCQVDFVELIAITPEESTLLAESRDRPSLDAGNVSLWTGTVPTGGVVFRIRGGYILENAEKLMFYTNPVRVITRAD